MTWWPFNRDRGGGPSREALESLIDSERELREAKRLRSQAEIVGSSLAASHARNHIVASLERALRNNGKAV